MFSPNQTASGRLSSQTGKHFYEILHSETQNLDHVTKMVGHCFFKSSPTHAVLTVLSLKNEQTEDINFCVLYLQFTIK